MKKIPIVFTLDENYFMPAGVTLTSLLEHANNDTFYELILLETGLTAEHKDKLESLAKIYKNCCFKFYNMGKYCNHEKEIKGHEGLNQSVFYRLLIPEILSDYKKVIFSDLDVVFRQDLSEVFDIDLSEKYINACSCTELNIRYKDEIIYCPNYFNAGFLVMNLEKIRNDGKDKELLDYMNSGFAFPFNDQDILNIVFRSGTLYLSPRYNLIPYARKEILRKERWHNLHGKKECKEAVKNPAIIHYTSKCKPWNTKKRECKKEWIKYYKKSIFKDIPLEYKYDELISPQKKAWRRLINRLCPF